MELVLLMTYSADLISPSGSLSHLFLPSRRSAAAAAAEPGTTFGPAGISENFICYLFILVSCFWLVCFFLKVKIHYTIVEGRGETGSSEAFQRLRVPKLLLHRIMLIDRVRS